jgi:hypothetical protein
MVAAPRPVPAPAAAEAAPVQALAQARPRQRSPAHARNRGPRHNDNGFQARFRNRHNPAEKEIDDEDGILSFGRIFRALLFAAAMGMGCLSLMITKDRAMETGLYDRNVLATIATISGGAGTAAIAAKASVFDASTGLVAVQTGGGALVAAGDGNKAAPLSGSAKVLQALSLPPLQGDAGANMQAVAQGLTRGGMAVSDPIFLAQATAGLTDLPESAGEWSTESLIRRAAHALVEAGAVDRAAAMALITDSGLRGFVDAARMPFAFGTAVAPVSYRMALSWPLLAAMAVAGFAFVY